MEAEELAILPGMEELSAMMYVNQFRREDRYDVIVLDCAPTAESMRFVSMPTTLEWYMKHIFPFQRGILKAVRPLANRVSPVELPTDSYFANIQDLFGKPRRHRRTAGRSQDHQRAPGHQSGTDGAARDAARLRLLLAARPHGGWRHRQPRAARPKSPTRISRSGAPRRARSWRRSTRYFAPVPVKRVPLFTHEVLGRERLEELARSALRRQGGSRRRDPHRGAVHVRQVATAHYEVRLQLPFAAKGEIGLFKKGDELVVEIGTLRRHIGLPTSMAALSPGRAKLENRILTVEMKES